MSNKSKKKTKKQRIRPLAICIFRWGDYILVSKGLDPASGENFYRPVGGGIEFGEYAEAALVREVQEELEKEIYDLALLGILENLFEFDQQAGHEIVFVYDGRFKDESLYNLEQVIRGHEGKETFEAVWRRVEDCEIEQIPLYPAGLADLLSR